MLPDPARPDLVLEHLAWVRDLARALVRDPGRADDLVQDAWVRVQQSPPPAGRRDRQWLARVVRNLARDLRRGEGRRARRERAAARPEALPSDDALRDVLARQEELARWVRELDEPYRRTLLLRWLEGLDAERIAEGEGVSVATVRTRLRRGEALLRERAERETRGAGQAWLGALAGDVTLAALPSVATQTTSPFIVLAAMQVKLAVVLVLVALCGWLALRPPWRSPHSAPIDAPVPETTLAAGASLDSTAPEGAPTAARTEATTAAMVAVPEQAAETRAIELVPGRDLAVRVVDTVGEPIVGATVIIKCGNGSTARDTLRAQTIAPDGEARFANLAAAVGGSRRDLESVAAGLEVVGETKIEAALNIDALPDEPIVLIAPAHGRLDVRFVDLRGGPFKIDEWVYVTPLLPDALQAGDRRSGKHVSAHTGGWSTATFPIVEPGAALRLDVYDNGIRRGATRELAPFVHDEVREIEVALGETLPHVIGRMVDEAGAPILVRGIDVRFEPSGSVSIDQVSPDGAFQLSVSQLSGAGGTFAARLSLELWSRRPHEIQHLSGRFVARVPRDAIPVDVGVVVMRPAPVVLTGRIVDSDGAPIEGAYVSVYKQANRRAEAEVFDWHSAGVHYAYSDAEGHVVVQGDLPIDEYAARAHASERIDRGAQRFQLGASGLQFVLDRAHFVRGRLRLPEATRLEDLEVELRNDGATREWLTYASWRTGLAADGSFLLADVRPDVVSLALKRVGSTATLAVIEGVAPTPTRDRTQSSLDPWDLTRELVQVTTRVHLADGQPIPIGLVAVGGRAAVIDAGRCDALFERGANEEVLLFAPGHIPARFPIDAVPERVDLARGTAVEITLASPIPTLPEGWSLELSLYPEHLSFLQGRNGDPASADGRGGVRARMWLERVDVRTGETAWTLHAPEPGRYRVLWRVRRPGADPLNDSGAEMQLEPRAECYLVVERVPGATVTLRTGLDDASIAEVVEALRTSKH